MNPPNTLLVEGEDDKKFFTTLLKHELGYSSNQFSIEPPKTDESIHRNGFNTLLRILPSRLNFVRAEKIKNLGIVVDADSGEFGFDIRREQITTILSRHGYIIPDDAPKYAGELFQHPERSPVGLWIMPNHCDDGIFEDCLLNSITDDTQSELKTLALDTINTLGDKQLFRSKQLPKAHLSTWLAWQKHPGSTAAYAYYQNLFNKNDSNLTALINWLQRVLPNNNE